MAPSGAPAWSIVSQREDFQAGPNGQLAAGVVVTFTTASGVTGSVFVPNADYTVDRVRQAIANRAQAMESVQKLTGA